ncbi:decarboxylase [Streptomyces sp. NPDC004542]|uniref:maleate cis-trans isomerase family protein n=1 Tax=Streptomyces sp. NPDC004542 TaxID=3154281 RepID=UPI0033A26677
MTALGILYPGHFADDDFARIEQLLGSDIRVDLVRTEAAEDHHRADAPRDTASPERLAAGVEGLRLSGAEAVVWASPGGSFDDDWEGAHEQVRDLARAAGLPASSTSFGFVHAARELGARRVAVAAPGPKEAADLFADFLRAGGVEVAGVRAAGAVTAQQIAGWGEAETLALARAADVAGAEAVVLPDTAWHTAAYVRLLEEALGKPVLTANQVTVWEALRLADRRVNAPELGALFTREPIVQV